MKSMLKVSIALIAVLFSINGFSQDLKTSLKVSKGQEFNQQMDMNMDITQSMGGQEMKMNNNSSLTSKFKVMNVLSTGNISLEASNWDIKTQTKAPMMDTTVTLQGKQGPVFMMDINKYGKVVSKTITDSTDIKGVNIGNNLVSSGIFCEFPEKDVLKVGEKWSINKNDTISQMGGRIGINYTSEFTLGAVEVVEGKSLQKILLSGNVEMGGKAKQMGMDIFIEGTGVSTGTIFIDPVTKVININNTVIELDMNLAITGQQNMTIPMTQKITVNQKLK
jgi:hypothetical protein